MCMFISEDEKSNILDFFGAVDEMIGGRFILSDTKVSNILKAVVKSEILYDLYTACMDGFNFAQELEKSLASNPNNGGYFLVPENEKDIVAFVTCLLLEVDKKHINLQSFVTDNFYSADGYNISYNNFALTLLTTYKNSIKSLLNMDEEGNVLEEIEEGEQLSIIEEEKVETDQRTKMLFASLRMNINELQEGVNNEYKMKRTEKEELLIVIKALNRALLLEELIIINALLVPLEYSLKKYRRLKPIFENIKMLIADIYY